LRIPKPKNRGDIVDLMAMALVILTLMKSKPAVVLTDLVVVVVDAVVEEEGGQRQEKQNVDNKKLRRMEITCTSSERNGSFPNKRGFNSKRPKKI